MEPWTHYLTTAALTLLGAAFVLAFLRLALGPSLADRVVALDLMAYIFLAFVGVLAITSGHTRLLDVALGVGIMIFMGTMAFARYIERVVVEEEQV